MFYTYITVSLFFTDENIRGNISMAGGKTLLKSWEAKEKRDRDLRAVG